MNIDWFNIWLKLFGQTQWLGLDIGFWVSMAICVVIVIIMNIVFWGMPPKKS